MMRLGTEACLVFGQAGISKSSATRFKMKSIQFNCKAIQCETRPALLGVKGRPGPSHLQRTKRLFRHRSEPLSLPPPKCLRIPPDLGSTRQTFHEQRLSQNPKNEGPCLWRPETGGFRGKGLIESDASTSLAADSRRRELRYFDQYFVKQRKPCSPVLGSISDTSAHELERISDQLTTKRNKNCRQCWS